MAEKLTAQAQELRGVTDYAHDNKCPTYNSGYKDGVEAADNTDYKNGDLVGYDSSYHPGYCSNQKGSYNNGDLLNDHKPHYLTFNESYLGNV
ncbi:hypothetical protein ES708_34858 [subsurface metagenome]